MAAILFLLAAHALQCSTWVTSRCGSPVVMLHSHRNYQLALHHLLGAAAGLALSSASPSAAVSPELMLADFEDPAKVSAGLKAAGVSMSGDQRMIKLWARLKAGAIQQEGRAAAEQVGDEKELASARMRVRSIQPYLDEAQRDIFALKWKFLQAYLGVVFSQVDAFQTVIVETYPGDDPVSLASKDALVTEGNNVVRNAELLASAANLQSQPQAIAAFAKLSLSYDRFLKAGDLYGNSLLLPSGTRLKKAPPTASAATAPPAPAGGALAAEKAAAEKAAAAATEKAAAAKAAAAAAEKAAKAEE